MRMVESLARKGRVLPIAAVLGAAALLAAPGASAQERLRVIITETEVPLVPNSVMELAYNMGIFADLGLELQIIRVEQTPSAIAALYSGAGDMANVSVSSVVQLVARDQIDLVLTDVVLPGTAPTADERLPVYNNKERGHDALFRNIATRHFEAALDDIVGPQWRWQREQEAAISPDPDDLDAWFPRR